MNAHAAISAASSIQGLLDILATIEVGETYAPGAQKFSHFKAFGMPDDFTKRIIIHLSDLKGECDRFVRDFKKKDLHDKVDTIFAENEADTKAGVESVKEQQKLFDAQLDTRMRRISYVMTLLHEEVVRQFPEAGDNKIDHLYVDEDWTIGWVDHTTLYEEYFKEMFGGDRSDPLDGIMALGPDGRPMSVDEALKDLPPGMAEAIKGDLAEIVGTVRARSVPGASRDGKGLSEMLAGVASAIARRSRRPGQ